jgi:hypothetical protein
MRQAVDELRQAYPFYGVWGTGVQVQTLLERGTQVDLTEARDAIDRLANLRADQDSAMLEITRLRLRTLLAPARGDDIAYRDYRDRYRAMAESLGFEGHIAWAKAMVEDGPEPGRENQLPSPSPPAFSGRLGAGRRCQAPPLKRGALSRIRGRMPAAPSY